MTNEEIIRKVFTPEQLIRMDALGGVERIMVYNSVIVGYKHACKEVFAKLEKLLNRYSEIDKDEIEEILYSIQVDL